MSTVVANTSDAPPLDSLPSARPMTLADLVAGALAEQQQLSAVERFSQWHEHHDASPLQSRHYRSLMPANPPGAGEQYAFDVDLDACSGCKSCVVACHALNGLDKQESWRDVGLLMPADPAAPAVLQYVTTACHHCLEPACASGCPVNAYEKDPVTGIVRHLDDQCFGCTYCTMACPYEAPKYHAGKGIVRKCDMCTHRLADGEAPACVQSCPNEAIRITVVKTEEVRRQCGEGSLAPGAVTSAFTLPTTRFTSAKRDVSKFRPADEGHARPQHAHGALVVMLVLTQAAVGALAAVLAWAWLGGGWSTASGAQFLTGMATLAAMAAVVGVAAATLHLGRPQYAFRALLGVTHSWLSREIVAFGAFMPLAVAIAAAAWAMPYWPVAERLIPPALAAAVGSGLVAIWCSVKIYQFTRRPFWVGANTAAKFFLTAGVLGASVACAGAAWAGEPPSPVRAFAFATFFLTLAKVAFEVSQLRAIALTEQTSLASSAKLLRNALRLTTSWRLALGTMGGIVAPAISLLRASDTTTAWLALLACGLCLAGELLERTLFFQAVVPLKMPGGLPA